MREIIKRGPSAEKVIEEFKKGFRVDHSRLKYVIEHKGSRGLLSLFKKKDAVVKFIVPETEDLIKDYLKTLLKHLEITFKSIDVSQNKTTYHAHIKGVDNPGFLIGKDGKMLASIQILLNKLVDDKENKSDNVVLDIENYKARFSSDGQENKRYSKSPNKKEQSGLSPRKDNTKPRRIKPRRRNNNR